MGLREKKKKETKEKIINAARDILLSKGYNDTTMEKIAEKAEIGVGTVYNYFKSKAEIFVLIMSEELLLNEENNEQLEVDLKKDVTEIIIAYLWKLAKGMKLFGKKIWRELFAVMLGGTKADNLMFRGMVKVDFMFIEKVEYLLDSIKQRDMLPHSFDSNEAAYTIYSIVITQTMLYVYMEEITFEDYTNCIENQIKFLFEGKC